MEIKFRGFSKELNKWVYGYYMKQYLSTRLGLIDAIFYTDQYTHRIPVIPESVGMFTGLKDKHRKEIYEGDVINVWLIEETRVYLGLEKQKISFVFGAFGISSKNKHGVSGWLSLCSFDREILDFEVIGNTYENSELLK